MMLTPRQAAKMLNCSADTVRRMCATGVLRSINIGTRDRAAWRIFEDTLLTQTTPDKPQREIPSFSGTPMLDKYTRRQ
jgi:excisionase family DNA binding protein